MLPEIQQHDIIGKKLDQHQKISFVRCYGKKYSCLQHPELEPMNRGAIRQHIEGKKHRLNFYTGEPLKVTENPHTNLDKLVKGWSNQTTKNSNNSPFWELREKLRAIFLEPDPSIASFLTCYGLEGKLRDDVCIKLVERGINGFYGNMKKT